VNLRNGVGAAKQRVSTATQRATKFVVDQRLKSTQKTTNTRKEQA